MRLAWGLGALVFAACAEAPPPTPAVLPAPTVVVPGATAAAPQAVPAAAPRAPTTGAACAGDAAWVMQVGGKPVLSTLMRFEEMRRRGNFGPPGPVNTFDDFGAVTRASQEKYEWTPAREGDRNNDVVVLRSAKGAIPNGYGAPIRHPNRVLEHPPAPSVNQYFVRTMSLFVFPDDTWVRTEGAMTTRVRELFAIPGTAPPLPTADKDVAWEICGSMDVNELPLPYDVWQIEGERVAVRLFASRAEGELVYPFLSPDLAAQAASAQASRCSRASCDSITSSSVEGPLVRYGVRIKTPPTAARAVLVVGEPTHPLAAPPPPLAPATPGTPATGTYQQFEDVRVDTCTHLAGTKFPSMMTSIVVTHRQGKPVATLQVSDPRARGIMTGGPMGEVQLTPGSVARKDITHLCQGYKMARTMTVLDATGDLIRVRYESKHVGSTAGCSHASLPSNCTTEVITTWKLARKACDGACDATLIRESRQYGEGDPAPRIDVTCACPP